MEKPQHPSSYCVSFNQLNGEAGLLHTNNMKAGVLHTDNMEAGVLYTDEEAGRLS